ncbi:MAG TPA: hypothetical protein PL157_15340 [Acidobacteriota bacterium]|nr:hypothetical protein [Acidobacteriota bacterium]HNH83742.1 hypothetical protein [Acidobacteriota bacterium]
MGLFHQLQDIYFDALKLADELAQLPPTCDCCDLDKHQGGKCCCSKPLPEKAFSHRTGCLSHIQELKHTLLLFDEDVIRSRAALYTAPGEALRQVHRVLLLKNSLMTALTHIEDSLNTTEGKCAHASLEHIQEMAGSLRRQAAQLNEVL